MSYGQYKADMASGYYPSMSYADWCNAPWNETEPELVDVEVVVDVYTEDEEGNEGETYSATYVFEVEDTGRDDVMEEVKYQLWDKLKKDYERVVDYDITYDDYID